MAKKNLTPAQKSTLIATLEQRFENNIKRHPHILWSEVLQKLNKQENKLYTLWCMEETGGEPDVVALDTKDDAILYVDCSKESPIGRRSICYDEAALQSRKEHKPAHSAIGMANEMGIEILNETQFRLLQKMTPIDTKTSSWILTPLEIREKGGALFADDRYGHVFVYHNGAESYYAARGFRGYIQL